MAWIAVVGTVLGGTALMAVADQRPSAAPQNAAEAFLPPDGSASELTYSTGEEWILESAFGTGPQMLLQLPSYASAHQFNLADVNAEGYNTDRYWRQTWSDVSGERPQLTELYELDVDGVRMLTLTGGESGFSFEPGLLSLPADIHDGSTWSSEGFALPQQLIEYRSTGSAKAGPDGCLVVQLDVVYTDPDAADAVLLESADTSTWCPGRGVVESEYTTGGEPGTSATRPLPEDRRLESSAASPRVDLLALADSAAQDVSLLVRDPLFGEQDFPGTTDGTVAATSDGAVVFASTRDLLAYRAAAPGEPSVREWVAHPGGTITTLTAIGDVVLVGTTDRAIQAYDSAGRRGWTARFDDVVLAPPVPDGRGGALILSVDGELRRVSLGDGSTTWSTGLGGDSAIAPAVGDGVVVAINDAEDAAMVYDLDDGTLLWSQAVERPSLAAVVDGRVIVASYAGSVLAWDATSGEARWSSGYVGIPRAMTVLGDTIVVAGSDMTAGYSLTGAVRWTIDASDRLLSDGTLVALLGPGAVRLVDENGSTVTTWMLDPARFATTMDILAVPGGFWVTSSSFEVQEVRTP
ncbi:PQQ-binding-like beta-propeller repeat protein [Salinibacterium soli]|uniref:PQQ-binding-like beta-propeller repeat protein n=1 Tax=Antiquaquibacter soli TaxID=3064523 RepID=A0ABT9BW13_9MICO|nr:PQQ-binding-like beta-propeller repeat protein [Protaetiibacter sp. WY-16]MDO7883497.1 PQQ-binding-like beta-propeller repeat protein [Protaetiibacter sp. WY-16]